MIRMTAHSALRDGGQGARCSEWLFPSQAEQHSQPPAKPVPQGVAPNLRVCVVAYLANTLRLFDAVRS